MSFALYTAHKRPVEDPPPLPRRKGHRRMGRVPLANNPTRPSLDEVARRIVSEEDETRPARSEDAWDVETALIELERE